MGRIDHVVLRHLLCRAGLPESLSGFHVAHCLWYSSHQLLGICVHFCAYWTTCNSLFVSVATVSMSWQRMVQSLKDSRRVWCKVPCPRDAQATTLAGSCACRCATTGAPVQTVRHCLEVAAHGRGELRWGFFCGRVHRHTAVGVLSTGTWPPIIKRISCDGIWSDTSH